MKQFENTNHHHSFYHTTHQREASKNADKKFIDDKIELTRSDLQEERDKLKIIVCLFSEWRREAFPV